MKKIFWTQKAQTDLINIGLILPQKTGERVKPLFLSYTIPAHNEQVFSSH
ncbi:hypothetical protein SAMN04487931_104366 [Desulfobacula phenolica]|uniref:Uncharacterized protein n=1 Tax=Desulfobacula phenolica TaxID=90732 RepID=A0A1H2FVK6_9BACT|nr:hypothetical protein SAMN04487931_104366 [Desulfobacula phenolica]